VLKHTWFGKQPRCILYRGLLQICGDRLLTKLYLMCFEYFKKRGFLSWIGSKSFKYNIPTQRNLRYSSACTCKGTRCFGIQPSHIFSPRNLMKCLRLQTIEHGLRGFGLIIGLQECISRYVKSSTEISLAYEIGLALAPHILIYTILHEGLSCLTSSLRKFWFWCGVCSTIGGGEPPSFRPVCLEKAIETV
jgi:hypothetical protein